jgi:hypothetical protein
MGLRVIPELIDEFADADYGIKVFIVLAFIIGVALIVGSINMPLTIYINKNEPYRNNK